MFGFLLNELHLELYYLLNNTKSVVNFWFKTKEKTFSGYHLTLILYKFNPI